MAIIKRNNKYGSSYLVRYQGSDCRWINRTFRTKRDAEAFEMEQKQRKRNGEIVTRERRNLTVDEFCEYWIESLKGRCSDGWLKIRKQQYRDYIQPVIGNRRLQTVHSQDVLSILSRMSNMEMSAQLRLHVFNFLRQFFKSAIEDYNLLTFNPALPRYKPLIPRKEAVYLNLDQVRMLLDYVKDKPFGYAIWIHLMLGLRVGELQALRWEDISIQENRVSIRRAYVRKEKLFRNYPKGRKQHSKPIPPELVWAFEELMRVKDKSDLVVRSPSYHMLSYEHYCRTLKRYCEELGLPVIGTHGLRHSTSSLYLEAGASKDTIQELFNHSDQSVTERYMHQHGSELFKVAEVIQLFRSSSKPKSAQFLHKRG